MQTESQAEVQRGLRVAASLSEIMPHQANPRLQPIYEDIQRTFRVPVVNAIFRILANYPDYLERAWGRFQPVARSRSFEQAADALRARSLLAPPLEVPRLNPGSIREFGRLRAFNDTIHYVLPKLLLFLAAQRERGGEIPPQVTSDSELPLGIAEGTDKAELLDPDEPGELKDLFEAIKTRHGQPLVTSYYRGLGNWPDVLRIIWEALEPRINSPEYHEHRDALVSYAHVVARGWPAAEPRPDTSQEQEVQAILCAFRLKIVPEMLIEIALIKSALDGPVAATQSRFSAAQ